MRMVSKRDLDSADLENREDIEESHDGDDGQRRGANQRRSHGKHPSIDILSRTISSSNVCGVSPFISFSGFVLSVLVSTSHFVVSHLLFWHVLAMERTCWYLRSQPLLGILFLRTVLFPTLRRRVSAPLSWENQRHAQRFRTVATALAKCIQIRNLCPNARPDSSLL